MAPTRNGYLILFGLACLAIPIAEMCIAYRDIDTAACLTPTAGLVVTDFAWLLTLSYTGLALALFYLVMGVTSFSKDLDDYAWLLTWVFLLGQILMRTTLVVFTGIVLWGAPNPGCYETGMMRVMLSDFIWSCILIGYIMLKAVLKSCGYDGEIVSIGIHF